MRRYELPISIVYVCTVLLGSILYITAPMTLSAEESNTVKDSGNSAEESIALFDISIGIMPDEVDEDNNAAAGENSIWNNIMLDEFITEDESIPHLIQTVTEQDIYEGMLALGLLEAPVLLSDDCEMAYENVKSCIVRISMGNANGSGIIWEMTPGQTIIVTNKHVLEYWDELISYIQFPQGYFVDARIIGTSDNHDVGFLSVDNSQLDYTELETLRYVSKDMESYEAVKAGDEIFCMGAEFGINADDKSLSGNKGNFYKGYIGDMNRYIDEFGEYMIYALGYAKPGMSGGGTFDAKGNLIGMISGGTAEDETASVPLTVIIEEYSRIAEDGDSEY